MNAEAPAASEARTGLEELLAAEILAVDGRPISGRDLLAAGVVSGRWHRLEHDLALGLALAVADPPPEEEVAEAMRAFRLDRGLLSAEDLKAWMRVRGLTLAAVKGAAARHVARRRGGGAGAAEAEAVAAALPAEAIFTGALQEIGLWLADRILSAAVSGVTVEALPLEDQVVRRLVFDEAQTVAGRASPEPGVERAARLGWVAALAAAHAEWEGRVVGPAEVARRLREQELAWCRLGFDELRLDSDGAAAEAVRQLADGVEPARIAEMAGVPLASRSILLADAPPEVARALVGAIAGDVVGPIRDGDAHVVVRVHERRTPAVEDKEIAGRARAELLLDAAARLRAGRIRWHDRA